MISDGFETKIQRENETTKGTAVGFEPDAIKSWQKLRYSPRPHAWFHNLSATRMTTQTSFTGTLFPLITSDCGFASRYPITECQILQCLDNRKPRRFVLCLTLIFFEGHNSHNFTLDPEKNRYTAEHSSKTNKCRGSEDQLCQRAQSPFSSDIARANFALGIPN